MANDRGISSTWKHSRRWSGPDRTQASQTDRARCHNARRKCGRTPNNLSKHHRLIIDMSKTGMHTAIQARATQAEIARNTRGMILQLEQLSSTPLWQAAASCQRISRADARQLPDHARMDSRAGGPGADMGGPGHVDKSRKGDGTPQSSEDGDQSEAEKARARRARKDDTTNL